MKRLVCLLFVALAMTGIVFAGRLSGEIVYLDGTVDVYRDGKKLEWQNVDIGFYLEPYDTLETGKDGSAEIDVVTASGTSAVVQVSPDTAFYLTDDAVGGKQQSSFTMMKGSLSFRVRKLTSNESFHVRTESAVMGIRGTSFDVASSPEGGILVLCDEGAVECADPQGRSIYAEPGQVVENVPETEISAFAVAPEDLDTYKNYWISKRMDVFKNGADTFIRGYARQYQNYYPKFEQAYRLLAANRALLERYGKAGTNATGTLFQVKSKISPSVIKMRSILPLFEQVFYRLDVLADYHEQGIGRTRIDNTLSSTQFFTRFGKSYAETKLQLSDVRYLFKLYKEIDDATGGGTSGLLDNPFSLEGTGHFGGKISF
ncbi:FecR family protein [Sediminispirochaeta smaragdinae]|uniref:Anti-FecI sigma factor, FecR n=1 Tax=Sediminispirochaeta smaragdinae (strain DSM 11293 / JCM 15392 / SEBR 4228) TaxID=573413 RepID=E1R924_SEDSS|nr:FecR family protein [Sediminispirochaeta smaragdinae]ADK82993.1 anti-FecI sigma factor, FecR [Sediminispirochaeta smaragdinae DSM 11293]